MTLRTSLFLSLAIGVAAGASGCAAFVQLPVTPGLERLSEDQVFAGAPPPEWPVPQPDSSASAAVDVACGVGPRIKNGSLYAAVSVRGRPPAAALPPLNVALVLDRSGSMHGDPFRNMLEAAEGFAGQLRDGDRMSLVAFSDGVYLAVPPVVIDATTRAAAIGAIRALGDGGGTNFSGGLLAGLAQVFGAYQPWQVNQVVLFSDGQPNIGITSSGELTRIAGRAAEHGVAVTTIGFGMEHDELLMQGIADASGGNYYYVDNAADMSRIFRQEVGAILRSAARATDLDLALPQGLELEEAIGYDYVTAPGHVYVRLGAIPHGEERYVVFRFHNGSAGTLPIGGSAGTLPIGGSAGTLPIGGSAGTLPIGVVYADVARRGRFGLSCAPGLDAQAGGRDGWALELAGRAEAAYGLQESMAWADAGNEVFVISQIGHTRSIISALREKLGPAALTPEDNMLLEAQASLGFKVVTGAATSYLDDGITGLMDFGKQQAVSNATTAVTYNVDKTFHTRARVGVAVTFEGSSATRYAVRGTPYKPRDKDASIRFKRARWKSYQMMRTR
jgi:hypothetical protein